MDLSSPGTPVIPLVDDSILRQVDFPALFATVLGFSLTSFARSMSEGIVHVWSAHHKPIRRIDMTNRYDSRCRVRRSDEQRLEGVDGRNKRRFESMVEAYDSGDYTEIV